MSLSPSGAAGNVIPKGYKTGQLQQFTPEQMQLFKQNFAFTDPSGQLFQRAMGNDAGFAPFEQQAQRDFQNFQGQTASRFSGLGMGARHGSGFQNLQTQGAQDFASQLSMQREKLKRQALMDLRGLSNDLLGYRPYQQFLTEEEEEEQPWWKQALGIGLPIAGTAAGAFFGGPAGAAIGGNIGSAFGSAFSGKPSNQNWQGISSLPTSWGSKNNSRASEWDRWAELAS